ncbi:MAG: hypothetical protein IH946_01375 [Bacteroidetes bacterium]|nr:hypothetical protein [Bacteroidota bacterium]
MGKGGGGAALLDDYQAIGVNPSALGYSGKKAFSLGVLNFGVDLNSKGLANLDLLTYRSSFSSKDLKKFSGVFRDEGFNLNVDMTWLGMSFKTDNLGGFAFSVRDRSSSHISMGENTADLIFNGPNAAFFQQSPVRTDLQTTDIVDDAEISFMHYRELNLSYGLKFLELGALRFMAGVGIKDLYGLGYFSLRSKFGVFEARSSFLGAYEIDYDELELEQVDLNNSFFNSSGRGQAIDLSVTMEVGEKESLDHFIISMSVTDIGSITWTKNVLIAANSSIDSIDASDMAQLNSFAIKDLTEVFFGPSGFIQFQQGGEFTTPLPATFRFALGKQFKDALKLSLDFVAPLNEKYAVSVQDPYIIFGVEVSPVPKIRFMSGVSRSFAFGYNLPFGFVYRTAGVLEYQVATADLSTFFRGNGSRLSIAMGIRLALL